MSKQIETEKQDRVLQNFNEKFSASNRVAISRFNNETQRYKHVLSTDPAAIGEVIEDYLQRNFGGGNFKVVLHDENGRVIGERSPIEIENPPGKQKEEPAPAVAGLVPTRGGMPIDIFQFMQEERARQHELMLEMIRAQGSSKTPVMEMINGLAQLRALEPKTPPPPPQAEELFLKGIEFARKASGSAGKDDDGFMGIVREVLELAKPIIAAQVNPPLAGNPAAPAAAPIDGQAGQVEEEEFTDEQIDIEPALTYLKGKFRNGTPIPMIAEMILDYMQLSSDVADFVNFSIQNPVEQFLSLDDEFSTEPFKTAATNLHAELKRRLTPAAPTTAEKK